MLKSIPVSAFQALQESDRYFATLAIEEIAYEIPGHAGVYEGFYFVGSNNSLFRPTPWFDVPKPTDFANDDAWGVALRETFWRNERENRHVYGVADDLDQIMTRMPWLVSDPQAYALVLRTIERASSPGWRWHKNGPYIGDFTDLAEHLGDSDPAIESVLQFEVQQHPE